MFWLRKSYSIIQHQQNNITYCDITFNNSNTFDFYKLAEMLYYESVRYTVNISQSATCHLWPVDI